LFWPIQAVSLLKSINLNELFWVKLLGDSSRFSFLDGTSQKSDYLDGIPLGNTPQWDTSFLDWRTIHFTRTHYNHPSLLG